jgi:Kef-type K+ transport system membrane component KefB
MITEVIGIHTIFGAFMFGVIMPRKSALIREFTVKIEDFTTVVLLPLFFAYTGLRTQIGLLNQPALWLVCLLVILVATAGKFGGAVLAARWVGLGWRPAAAIGVLMNTRGLMELIVLNIGLDLGVISPTLFAMMVIMAIVTTFITTPILHVLYPELVHSALHAPEHPDLGGPIAAHTPPTSTSAASVSRDSASSSR